MTSLPDGCSVLHWEPDPGGLQCGLLRQQWSRLWTSSSRRVLQLLGYWCHLNGFSLQVERTLFTCVVHSLITHLHAGLDGSAYDNQFTVTLPANTPTHAMTGEWCTQNGTYARLNDTSLQAISSYPGPFCTKLDAVLCYRRVFIAAANFLQSGHDFELCGSAPAEAAIRPWQSSMQAKTKQMIY